MADRGCEEGSRRTHLTSQMCTLLGQAAASNPCRRGTPPQAVPGAVPTTRPCLRPVPIRVPAAASPPYPQGVWGEQSRHAAWRVASPHVSLTWTPNSGPSTPHPPDPRLGLEGVQDETPGRLLRSAPGTAAQDRSGEDEGAGTWSVRPQLSAGAVPGRCPLPGSPRAAY